MSKGGARVRSGPMADPNSERSEKRQYTLTALPREGYSGKPPAFPLPIKRFYEELEGEQAEDKAATKSFRDRESAIWREYWKMPQACAWESNRWLWETLGELCRLKTVVEFNPDKNAALVAQLHRYRDQVGLTPAGMRDNGWKIADVEPEPLKAVASDAPVRRERRLRG